MSDGGEAATLFRTRVTGLRDLVALALTNNLTVFHYKENAIQHHYYVYFYLSSHFMVLMTYTSKQELPSWVTLNRKGEIELSDVPRSNFVPIINVKDDPIWVFLTECEIIKKE